MQQNKYRLTLNLLMTRLVTYPGRFVFLQDSQFYFELIPEFFFSGTPRNGRHEFSSRLSQYLGIYGHICIFYFCSNIET